MLVRDDWSWCDSASPATATNIGPPHRRCGTAASRIYSDEIPDCVRNAHVCDGAGVSAPCATCVVRAAAMSAAFFYMRNRFSAYASYPASLASMARRAGAESPKGKWRPRVSPTIDMGLCVFNCKHACRALRCKVTRNAQCFAFAVRVRDYRCCCVAWHRNSSYRHDRRFLVLHGTSVHGMSLLVVTPRADCGALRFPS
jgi:hypothetical protein